jgi:eukaryotic-like serine/threonine-protein kinase
MRTGAGETQHGHRPRERNWLPRDPRNFRDIGGTRRRTREGDIDKLRRRLTGDLDNIVLMALRKEPQRRYASAEQFSQDIRCHLDGLPVTARKNTILYRSSKFILRQKTVVAAFGLFLLALVAGVISTAWEARTARTQKARAEKRFNDVRQLANSFLFEFHDAIKDLPGATPARRLAARKALEYLDGLATEAGGDPSLQSELAEAYLRVGDVQRNPDVGNLGDTLGSLGSYRKACYR